MSPADTEKKADCAPRQGSGALLACLQPHGKVNLWLAITGLRPNGWHEINSLFVPWKTPCDILEIYAAKSPGLTLWCSEKAVDPSDNTLTKAYARYSERTGFAPPLHVRLEKHIPHGAGLGGGSADAAALLLWLNQAAPQPLSFDTLVALAAGVGADVPFFLHNTPCLVEGIGERIRPVPNPLAGWHALLVCPPVQVSTPWAYAAWDRWFAEPQNAVRHLTSFSGEDTKPIRCNASPVKIMNSFEPVVFECFPQLGLVKECLLQRGASAALMSGSGASLVGLFDSAMQVDKAMLAFAQKGFKVFTQFFE